jgi:hypothetical protein
MAKYKIMEYGKPDPQWNEDEENSFVATGLNSIAIGRLRIQFTEEERRDIEQTWKMIDNGELNPNG